MSRKLNLENIFNNKLYEILDDRYNDIIHLNKSKIKKCKDCSYRYGCFECRALEISATDELDGIEYCELTKELSEVEG